MLRSSGAGLTFLLLVAYATGDEYPHTHMLIGYGIAAVIIANLYWELVHPHRLHSGSNISRLTFSTAIQDALSANSPAFVALTILALVSAIAGVAVALMVATHIWASPIVEEVHEAIAYFALGLAALHIVVVLIASAEYLERRLARALRRH
jgi:hypothetical protein